MIWWRRSGMGTLPPSTWRPRDYHRIHMPLDGVLESMVFVPGIYLSVNPLTAEKVAQPVRPQRAGGRHLPHPHGTMALVLVWRHYRRQHRDHLGRQHSADQTEGSGALGLHRRRGHHPCKRRRDGAVPSSAARRLPVWPRHAGRFRTPPGQRRHPPHGSALAKLAEQA